MLNQIRRCSALVVLSAVVMVSACGGGTADREPSAARSAAEEPVVVAVAQTVEVEPALPTTTPFVYQRVVDYPRIHVGPMQYVPTSTGQRVGLRVTLPADERGKPLPGPFPVILVQSGYNIGLMSMVSAPGGVLLGAPDTFLVRRGYAMVSADVIGTGISEGGWKLFDAEEQQGYGSVVDWIQQQPWADGKIGVAGVSYMAITSLFTAQQRPDDIHAVFASVPSGDVMRGIVGTGGLINGVFMGEWMTLTHTASTQNVPLMLLQPELMSQVMQATQGHLDQIDEYYLPLIEKAIQGDPELAYDGPFWRQRSPLEHIDRIKAPTFIMGALNDIFQRAAPLLYEQLKGRVDTRLMLFDGDHISNFLQAFPGTEKTAPMMNMMLQWFDQYLKGMDTHLASIPPVTQYVKRYKAGTWQGFITAPDWPHPAAEPQRWYLLGDGQLSPAMPVSEEPARSIPAAEFADYHYGKSDDGGFLKLEITPKDGSECSSSYVQWTLGVAGLKAIRPCFWDHRTLEQGALNYETAPMDEDYFIAGPLQADVWVSSTVTDALVSVRVDEVLPSGRVAPITNGLLLASMRAVDAGRSRYVYGDMVQPFHFFTQEKEQFLTPGDVVKMQVEVFPTSALIRAGSKLRVSISSSNQAQGILNLRQRARVAGGVTTLHHGSAYPSSLVVLAVPLSELN